MTLTEIFQRAQLEAMRGSEAAEMANLDTQAVVQAILPSVLQEVTLKYAGGDEDKRSLLRQTHTVTLTDGVGTLPSEVLTTCIWGSSVWVESEPTVGPLMSYEPWISFISSSSDLIGRYSIRGDYELYWADAGETYPDLTRDTEVLVTIATVLTPPADPADPTGWPAEAESDVIDRLAEWLRGAKVAV